MPSSRRFFKNHCAEGTLECGGLTPLWNLHGAGIAQGTMYKGGVNPPHSKALRAVRPVRAESSDKAPPPLFLHFPLDKPGDL